MKTKILLLIALVCFTFEIQAQDYDVVILNGRVIDPETRFDDVRNVGVKDGKIAIITTEKITGKETIDATDHIVSPGFIDTHSHNVGFMLGQKMHLRDGVTTPMTMEGGVYPVGKFYDSMEGKSMTNYGATVSFMGARESIFNPKYISKDGYTARDLISDPNITTKWSTDVATKEQIDELIAAYETGLKEGALGVGATAGYMPDGLTTTEIERSMKLVAKYGGVMSLHGRYSSQVPPNSGMLGTSEAMAALAAHGGALIVCHMTAQCLDLSGLCQEMIDDAYSKGHQVVGEVYAYTYGSTIAGAPYLQGDKYKRNMNRDFCDIVDLTTLKPQTEESFAKLVKETPNAPITFENATKEDLFKALAHPTSIIGSDAFVFMGKKDGKLKEAFDTPYNSVNGHPRGAGTRGRILRLVREENLMPINLAIAKMTYMPAKFLQDNGIEQMTKKGRMQEGMDADITIFDPKTVKDNATPEFGGLPTTGIPYVLVNGTIMVKNSKVLKDVYPGKAIRKEIVK